MGERASGNSRLIAAVATPVRAFAAALCGVGAVLRLSAEPVAVDVGRRLAELTALPLGASVVCRNDNAKTQRGVFAGFDEIDGCRFVVVDIGGSVARKIPVERCDRIEVFDGEAPSGRRVATVRTAKAGLVSAAFGDGDATAFLRASRLDCILVARERELEFEVGEPFALVSGRNTVEGCLQDLLRIMRFGRKGDAHRCDVVPTISWPVRRDQKPSPAVVVFDGAHAYLRWGEIWPSSHHIVVLDRRDSRFDEAVDRVNATHIRGRVNGLVPQLPPTPVSLECMVFPVTRA